MIPIIFLLSFNVYQVQSSCVGPLDCWLKGLTFFIPNNCFEYNGHMCCVSKLECKDISLESLSSRYVGHFTLALNFHDIQARCTGTWKYWFLGGNVVANVKNTEIDLGLTVSKSGSFVNSVNFSSCMVPSITVDLHFTGSFVGVLLQVLSKQIDNKVQSEIRYIVCHNLAELVAKNGTYLIRNRVNPMLQSIITSQPSPSVPMLGYVDWRSSGFSLYDAYLAIQSFLGKRFIGNVIASLSKHSNELSCVVNYSTFWVVTDSKSNRIGKVYVQLRRLSIGGLSDLLDDGILIPSKKSNVTLYSTLFFPVLTASLTTSVRVALDESGNDVRGMHDLEEPCRIDLDLRNVTLSLDLVAAVKRYTLEGVYGDQLFDRGALGGTHCIASAFDHLYLRSLNFISSVRTIDVHHAGRMPNGTLESDVDRMISQALLLLTRDFSSLTSDTISGLFQGPLRQNINRVLSEFLSDAHTNCEPHVDTNGSARDFLSWNSNALRPVWRLLADIASPPNINAAVDHATKGTGSIVLMPADLPDWTVEVSGLDTFRNTSIISPVTSDAHELSSSVAVGGGVCRRLPSWRHNCSAVGIAAWGSFRGRASSVAFETTFTALRSTWSLLLDLNALRNMPVTQLASIECLSTATSVKIEELEARIGDTSVEIDGKVFPDGDVAMRSVLQMLSSPTSLASFNMYLSELILRAEQKCGEPSNSTASIPGDSDARQRIPPAYVIRFAVLSVLSFFGVSLALYIAAWPWWRATRREAAGADPRNAPVEGETDMSFEPFSVSDECSSSLVFHKGLHVAVRGTVPLLIAANMLLFLWSNLSIAAKVNLNFSIVGSSYSPEEPLFVFSLGNTVREMWRAGVYPLAVLIAFFSGAWPYAKLVLMLVAWLTPARAISPRRRESILIWLDFLGKYSLVDIFVLVLMIAAFHVQIALTDGILATVTVYPTFGFYSFLTATILSLLLGHIVLAAHRYVSRCRNDSKDCAPQSETVDSLIMHEFVLGGSLESQTVRYTPASTMVRSEQTAVLTSTGVCLGSFLLGSMLPLLLAGVCLYTLRFRFQGLVGWWLGKDSQHSFSVLSLAQSLPRASGHSHDDGIFFIQIVFLTFAFVMPVLSWASFVVLWAVPLSVRTQRRVFVTAEILNAWSAIDVFAISTVAAILQIRQFASFIVGDSCDLINALLRSEQLAFDQEFTTCFDVVAVLSKVGCSAILLRVLIPPH